MHDYTSAFLNQSHSCSYPQKVFEEKPQFLGIFWVYPRKSPNFWGCFKDKETPNFRDGDGDRVVQNFGDILGMGTAQILGIYWGLSQKTPNFGDGDGVSPLKMFGDGLGTGNPQILGTFDEKSPKTPKFWGGDEGKNLGDFNHTMQESQLLYRPFSSVRAVARISF